MKKLLVMSFTVCITYPMAPKPISFPTKSVLLISPVVRFRTFAAYKGSKGAHFHHKPDQWKLTHANYQKALAEREKCKRWKQIGYGMHEGYCTSHKSCECTYRLILIARQ